MVAGGVEAEELAVELVGEQGERMPVVRHVGGQRPGGARAGDPLLDLRVAGDVEAVVEVDEAVVERGQIGGQGEQGERRAEEERQAAAGRHGGRAYQVSRGAPSSRLLRSRRARRFSTASTQRGTKATRSRITVSISESCVAIRRAKAA